MRIFCDWINAAYFSIIFFSCKVLHRFYIRTLVLINISFESILSFCFPKKIVYYFFFKCLIKLTSENIWDGVFFIGGFQIANLIFLTNMVFNLFLPVSVLVICEEFTHFVYDWHYLHKVVYHILSLNSFDICSISNTISHFILDIGHLWLFPFALKL